MGIQKYVTRPEKDIKVNADTAVFMWVNISIIGSSYIKCSQKNIEELMQINRYRLKDYIKGQRAISLALSTF